MKNAVLAFAILLALSSCKEQQKIGFVNNSKLINDYKGKKDIEDKYKGFDEASKKRADSLSQAYQIEAIELQQKMARMSQKQQQAAAEPFQQKWQLINKQVQAEQEELQKSFQEDIDASIDEVVEFVKDYAKTNGYNYIFGTSDVSRSVMYGDATNDLTDKVLEALNTSYTKED